MTASGDSVFIAYDLRDSDDAEALTAALEGHGLKVWLGWRDKAPAGNAADYAAQLGESAAACGAFVLLLAGSAGDLSERRDLTQRAYKADKPIFVVRADEGATVPDFPALLGVAAADVYGAQRESNLAALAAAIGAALPAAAAPPPRPAPEAAPPPPAPEAPAASYHAEPPAAPPPDAGYYAEPPAMPAAEAQAQPPASPPAAPPIYAEPPAPPAAAPPPLAPPPPAAAAYAPPPPPAASAQAMAAAPAAAPYDEENAQMLRAFVGPNADYYLRKWEEMRARNASTSWNWAAFLLSFLWLAYRRMIGPAGIFAGGFLLLQVAAIFAPGLYYFANGLTIGLAAWIGLNGNRLYRAHAERALAEGQAAAPDPQARQALLQARGGASMPLALGAALVWAVLVVGLFYMVAKQQRNASHAYSSSLGSSASTGTSSQGADSIFGPQAGSDESWIVGQWTVTSAAPGPYCSTWIRFNADHSLNDNAAGTGTWSVSGSGGTYTLTMTTPGSGPRSVPVTLSGDTMTMGSAGNSVTWQKTTC